FQGNAWLIFVDTPAGLVEVCELHRGAPPAAEGDRVALSWNGADAAIIVSGASHG
uniref:TOBE domain-containing protein n=1 Tax=Stenotrophomonas maltophilia TaxID=40324 RepID=UPI003CCFF088